MSTTNFNTILTLTDEESPEVNLVVTSTDSSLGGKRYTFSLGRSYIAGTQKLSRTGWMKPKDISAAIRLLERAKEALQQLEEQAKEERKQFLENLHKSKPNVSED